MSSPRSVLYLIVLLLAAAHPLAAQLITPPRGVYCSCGPTTGVGDGSVDPLVAAQPFVEGILVRVGWGTLEPREGEFHWSLIDDQLAAARSHGVNVALAVGCGPAIPQWVFDAGAARLVSSVPFHDTMAVPWDAVFLQKWATLIAALGKRYQDEGTIRLVYITTSSGNGYEMQLPFVTSPTLAEAGCSDARMIAAWCSIIDAFAAAFPRHTLTHDVHPVNGSDGVADSVHAHAARVLAGRYGVAAWWWTQKNTGVYPAQYALLQQSARDDVFAGIQMAYSGTKSPDTFGVGGMPAALQRAMDNGVWYWEIWNQDLLNPAFVDLLTAANGAATGMRSLTAAPASHLSVHPNPATTTLWVQPPGNDGAEVTLIDLLGRTVVRDTIPSGGGAPVTISAIPSGLYLLRCAGRHGVDHATVRIHH